MTSTSLRCSPSQVSPLETRQTSMARKKTKLCLCSQCRGLNHQDSFNIGRPGQRVDRREWRKHATDDELREGEEDYVGFLSEFVGETHSRSSSLAVRARDHLDFASHAVVSSDLVSTHTPHSCALDVYSQPLRHCPFLQHLFPRHQQMRREPPAALIYSLPGMRFAIHICQILTIY